MKKFKKDLKQGEAFSSVFFVQSSEEGLSRENKPNLKFSLADKSGKISGYLWSSLSEVADTVKEGSFAVVEGTPRAKEGSLYVKIARIRIAEDSEVDYADFGAVTPKGIETLTGELHELVDTIGDEDCRRLILSFTDDRSFMQAFRLVPAGKVVHHAYIGGLLEHTVGVMQKASLIAEGLAYRDILLTAAFLHDIGKTQELMILPRPAYSDEGSLLGHILLGCFMAEKAMAGLEDFPEELRLILIHMIASHHGKKEWGSPVLPSTPAAILLSYIDGMDARMNHAEAEIKKLNAYQVWGVYDWALKTRIYGKQYVPRDLRESRRLALV